MDAPLAFCAIVTNGPRMASGVYLGEVLRAMFNAMTPEQQAQVLVACGMQQSHGEWHRPPAAIKAPEPKPRSVWRSIFE